jgi:diadenylate cyclase
MEQELNIMLEEIIKAVTQLSKTKTGAIIILEQETGLNEHIETGTQLDSRITGELLINVFVPNTPLHDGALIIRKDRIAAAGCFLPLTQNQNLSKELGTRHRAALGITEISDALAIVVSEETGVVSFAMEGKISRYLDAKSLKEIVRKNYKIKELKQPIWTKWGVKDE